MSIKLDIKDKKILYELDMDARQSISSIAKRVGLSKEVVNYRIRRMEKEGLIDGYYAIIEYSKLESVIPLKPFSSTLNLLKPYLFLW